MKPNLVVVVLRAASVARSVRSRLRTYGPPRLQGSLFDDRRPVCINLCGRAVAKIEPHAPGIIRSSASRCPFSAQAVGASVYRRAIFKIPPADNPTREGGGLELSRPVAPKGRRLCEARTCPASGREGCSAQGNGTFSTVSVSLARSAHPSCAGALEEALRK